MRRTSCGTPLKDNFVFDFRNSEEYFGFAQKLAQGRRPDQSRKHERTKSRKKSAGKETLFRVFALSCFRDGSFWAKPNILPLLHDPVAFT
jgi:hypothetical protein